MSYVSFSFLLNGAKFCVLKLERGIRQGDSLSTYLFICMVETFIGMVNRAEGEGRVHGIKIAQRATNSDIHVLCR